MATDASHNLGRGFTQTPDSCKILAHSRDRITNYLGHKILHLDIFTVLKSYQDGREIMPSNE